MFISDETFYSEYVKLCNSVYDHMFNYNQGKLDEFQSLGWKKIGEDMYLKPLTEEELGIADESDRARARISGLKYSYLYRGNEKVTDLIYREGGLSSEFKGDYCRIILYDDPQKSFNDCIGTHVIINKSGDVVLRSESALSYPYIVGGCIASYEDTIYNLKTKSVIVKGRNSRLKCESFIFVENSYNDDFKKGVYKINLETGDFEVFN